MDDFKLSIRVEIDPLWRQPPESESQKVRRAQIEMRFDALASQIAKRLEAALADYLERQDAEAVEAVILWSPIGEARS